MSIRPAMAMAIGNDSGKNVGMNYLIINPRESLMIIRVTGCKNGRTIERGAGARERMARAMKLKVESDDIIAGLPRRRPACEEIWRGRKPQKSQARQNLQKVSRASFDAGFTSPTPRLRTRERNGIGSAAQRVGGLPPTLRRRQADPGSPQHVRPSFHSRRTRLLFQGEF